MQNWKLCLDILLVRTTVIGCTIFVVVVWIDWRRGDHSEDFPSGQWGITSSYVLSWSNVIILKGCLSVLWCLQQVLATFFFFFCYFGADAAASVCSHHSMVLLNILPATLFDLLHLTSNSLLILKATVAQTGQRG